MVADPDDGVAPPADAPLSIGRLARETGVPVETLRTWERRYGVPTPVRLPSGHRRYARDEVARLRRAAEAVALGARPSRVLGLPAREVEAWIAAAAPRAANLGDDWLAAARGYDEGRVRAILRRRRRGRSAVAFVSEVVGPALQALGRAWAEGRLDVRGEHFLSRAVGAEIRAQRRLLPARRGRPVVVLAGLPGEEHFLGLEMAALVAAEAGARCVMLGPNTPVAEIAAAATEARAALVAVSVSSAHAGPDAEGALADLRARLPRRVALVAGGAGARRRRRRRAGVAYTEDFARFDALVRSAAPRG